MVLPDTRRTVPLPRTSDGCWLRCVLGENKWMKQKRSFQEMLLRAAEHAWKTCCPGDMSHTGLGHWTCLGEKWPTSAPLDREVSRELTFWEEIIVYIKLFHLCHLVS